MTAAVHTLPIEERALDTRDLTIIEYADAGYSAAAIASMFAVSAAHVRRLICDAEEGA